MGAESRILASDWVKKSDERILPGMEMGSVGL